MSTRASIIFSHEHEYHLFEEVLDETGIVYVEIKDQPQIAVDGDLLEHIAKQYLEVREKRRVEKATFLEKQANCSQHQWVVFWGSYYCSNCHKARGEDE